MDAAAKQQACYEYLREEYYLASTGAWNVAALTKLRRDAFAEASEQVTIVSTASEAGGQASGVITFDKWLLIAALNRLLAEVNPNQPPPPDPLGSIPDFSAGGVRI